MQARNISGASHTIHYLISSQLEAEGLTSSYTKDIRISQN